MTHHTIRIQPHPNCTGGLSLRIALYEFLFPFFFTRYCLNSSRNGFYPPFDGEHFPPSHEVSFHVHKQVKERFCKTKMCTNFRSTSQSEKLRMNFRNFGRETCREREINFRRKFREIGSWRTCTWRMQTMKMCRTQSSCENSYTFSQGLSRNFVRIFVVQNLSSILNSESIFTPHQHPHYDTISSMISTLYNQSYPGQLSGATIGVDDLIPSPTPDMLERV